MRPPNLKQTVDICACSGEIPASLLRLTIASKEMSRMSAGRKICVMIYASITICYQEGIFSCLMNR